MYLEIASSRACVKICTKHDYFIGFNALALGSIYFIVVHFSLDILNVDFVVTK